MSLRSSGFAALAFVALTAASPAFAGDRVVIVAEPSTPLGARLEAELGAIGFDIERVAPSPEIAPEGLVRYAEDHEALASIMLIGREKVVEIWIADRATDKTLLRRIPIDGGGVTDDTAVTKTVELLRASLLEVRVHEPETRLPPAAERLVGPAPEPPPNDPIVTVRIAPSVAFRSGGTPPSAQLGVDVAGWIGPLFRIGGSLSIPTFPATLELDQGEISRTQFWGDASFEVHPYRGVVDPRVGLGLGVELSEAHGDAKGLLTSRAALTVSALGLLDVGLAIPIGRVFAIDTALACGLTLPKTEYKVLDSTAFSAGWPTCSAGLGVALDF